MRSLPVRFAVSANCYALFAEGLYNTIMVTCSIPLNFEMHSAKEMEEHAIVWLDTMDQFKECGEFAIFFSRKILDNLSDMMQCPEPVSEQHLHIGDICSDHSNGGLPSTFC